MGSEITDMLTSGAALYSGVPRTLVPSKDAGEGECAGHGECRTYWIESKSESRTKYFLQVHSYTLPQVHICLFTNTFEPVHEVLLYSRYICETY